MKLLLILMLYISSSAYAEEACIFTEAVYFEFIKNYSIDHSNAKIGPDGRTLLVNRNSEEIIVKGGGCDHLGMGIELRSKRTYTEEQFIQKTLDLAIEFGDWLINTTKLKDSVANGKYHKINGIYFFEVDVMTVFESSYDKQGNISVDFYIN